MFFAFKESIEQRLPCSLESAGELLEIPKARLYTRPFSQNLWAWDEITVFFQYVANFKNLWQSVWFQYWWDLQKDAIAFLKMGFVHYL